MNSSFLSSATRKNAHIRIIICRIDQKSPIIKALRLYTFVNIISPDYRISNFLISRRFRDICQLIHNRFILPAGFGKLPINTYFHRSLKIC
jgi:hypothetical protein